ncbi:PSD1 and planctomycete cytochrome C domain-containing protein [Lentisphaera marina]|uniref:PSD1 and planctomycete cytochrome C domain-containing protein n=1 Tax=Lentisphaera marina TaxID=1111041 RepID=UPI0023661F54|nr:PSD1 and planctomycete cytochrome C domain-containing protein [Lentisphaera marina]MDD7986475.1 PSD1 and planctomycete cytochrome C domain-containing protein [Lentisphaera marina]
MRSLAMLLVTLSTYGAVDFEKDIKPIFEKNCYKCHGEKKQKAGVALYKKYLAFQEADAGEPVIIPHNMESILLEVIEEEDEDFRMPPKKALAHAEIELIKKWIKEGAVWPSDEKAPPEKLHWAYIKPEKKPLPKVSDKAWTKNFIDYHVMNKLEAEGLKPEERASSETLIRRLSFDLTGLPPSLALLDKYSKNLNDQNYEKLVDELLSQKTFGENWARHWLDLARYADSNGYQRDGFQTLWPYRDWVIKAFNEDKTYDQFTIEQLAGDLLENPSQDQLIATGFNRCNTLNLEAGTDIEEDRVKQVTERVNTMGTVWLGSSVSCAQCHNHKYDPFTIKEYYQFYSFFNNTPIEAEEVDEKSSTLRYAGNGLMLDVEGVDPNFYESSKLELNKLEKNYQGKLKELQNSKKNIKINEARKIHQKSFKKNVVLNNLWKQIEEHRKIVAKHTPVYVEVMKEMDTARNTRILRRGNFLDPDQQVKSAVPKFLNPMPAGAPENRLGLAQWLTTKDNPLTARVAVNRFWREFMGTGIYESLEDIGQQGEMPTNHNLLDALALDFMENNWSMKKLMKRIVMSSTYQQSSVVSDEKRAKDPFNRLYARGASCRLTAEAIRDNALAISLKLSPKMYGPTVRPVQPDNIWRVTGGVDNTYRTSKGEDMYRRGLYTIWRRSAHYPSFANFDAPNRSACTVKRSRSNTPMQALTLMNDPVYVDIAQHFAKRIQLLAKSDKERIQKAFRLCTSRHASDEEQEIMLDILNNGESSQYDKWFTLATTLLNLHETISRD